MGLKIPFLQRSPGASPGVRKQIMTDKIKTIYAFIKANFSEYDLQRSSELSDSDYNNDFPFQTIEKFRKHQKAYLRKLHEEELDELIALISLIKKGLKNMDKESMSGFDSSGFCFDKNGQITLFNER